MVKSISSSLVTWREVDQVGKKALHTDFLSAADMTTEIAQIKFLCKGKLEITYIIQTSHNVVYRSTSLSQVSPRRLSNSLC